MELTKTDKLTIAGTSEILARLDLLIAMSLEERTKTSGKDYETLANEYKTALSISVTDHATRLTEYLLQK